MMMRPVPKDKLDGLWRHIAPHLRSFFAKYPGSESVGGVYDTLMSEHRQCYVVVDGSDVVSVVITTITDGGETLEMPIVAGAGSDDWAAGVLENIEQMAAANGVRRVRLRPRPGWVPGLGLKPSEGWVEAYRVYEKELA